MKALKSFMITLMITACFSVEAQTTEIQGMDFPNTVTIGNAEAALNGGGMRVKYWVLDLYVGALYLENKTSDPDQVVMADENMGIRIVINSAIVSRDLFIESLEEGFANATAGKHTSADIENFKTYLSDEFVKGDEIALNYVAGEGVHLSKNGEKRGTFTGLEFKQALFAIWLGGKPADEKLKNAMLGK